MTDSMTAPPRARTVLVAIAGGVLATLAFDLFGQVLSPMLGFAKLAPVGLARQSLGVLFGEEARQFAPIAHWLTGAVGYSLAYVFIARPFARTVTPGIPWIILAVVYGIVLWVFALYIMAHLVAGNPAFLGFSGLTWVALVGHIVFTVVLGAVVIIGKG